MHWGLLTNLTNIYYPFGFMSFEQNCQSSVNWCVWWCWCVWVGVCSTRYSGWWTKYIDHFNAFIPSSANTSGKMCVCSHYHCECVPSGCPCSPCYCVENAVRHQCYPECFVPGQVLHLSGWDFWCKHTKPWWNEPHLKFSFYGCRKSACVDFLNISLLV